MNSINLLGVLILNKKLNKDENETFDFKTVINYLSLFFKKKWFIVPLILMIISILLATQYRLYTLDLPITDVWARDTIYGNVESQLYSQIKSQNPLLPEENVRRITQQRFMDYIDENKEQINLEVTQFSNQIKSHYQYDDGQTYLLELDPYYYYRFYRNIINHGHPGEYMEDGRSYSNLRFAPNRSDVTDNYKEFHVFASLWTYRFFRIFNRNINPYTVFFLMPIFFSIITAIVAFLLGRHLAGNFGGLITSTYILLNPSLLARSPAGFSDTDIYNILFPLLMVYFMILSFRSKNLKSSIIYSSLVGLFAIIYSLAWQGWFFTFIFVGFAYGLFFLLTLITELRKKTRDFLQLKNVGIKIGAFVASTIIFLLIFGGNIISLLMQIIHILAVRNIQVAAHDSLWPNVFTTVAELNPGSIPQIVSGLGFGNINLGWLFIIFTLIGIALIWFMKGSINYRITMISFLFLWFFGAIYATTRGIRFLFFISVPVGIALGIFFGIGIPLISKLIEKHLEISKKGVLIFLYVIVFLILIGTKPISGLGFNGVITDSAHKISVLQIPLLNDAWHESLIKIRENSNDTAIITSWWDYGHHFVTIAERGVVADGASQNSPRSHWLGKLFITDDVVESGGIIRMLNCDGNGAYDKVHAILNDSVLSKRIVDNLVLIDESSARSYLSEYFDEEEINNITNSTHCNPPQAFVITSEDMACMVRGNQCQGKTAVWTHFGLWDFERARIWNIVKSNDSQSAQNLIMQEELIDTEAEARQVVTLLSGFGEEQANSWIAPWPGYYSPMSNCRLNDNRLSCDNGAEVDLTTMTAIVSAPAGGILPKSLVYIDDELGYVVKENESSIEDISIILRMINNQYQAMYAVPVVAESVFTRLFYLNDGGDIFEKFHDARDITGMRIITWTVNWDNLD